MGAVVLLVAGYLAAFGTTPTGQGWSLVPHLALDPGLPLAAPTLVVEAPQERPALPTLRSQSSGTAAVGGAARLPVGRPGVRGADGRHLHERALHAHGVPTPAPVEVPTLSLDKHRVPAPMTVPAPPASVAGYGERIEAETTEHRSVETPPPIGRG